jgi:ABC-type glycerol-3-phosphate transport system substrate-binding protein
MKEEIKDFILYLEKPENLSYYANQRPVGQLPATYSAIEAHWGNPIVAKRRDLVERHLAIAEKGHNAFFFDGPRPGRGRVFAMLVVSEGVQKVFLGEMSPREAIDWMEREIKDLM